MLEVVIPAECLQSGRYYY